MLVLVPYTFCYAHTMIELLNSYRFNERPPLFSLGAQTLRHPAFRTAERARMPESELFRALSFPPEIHRVSHVETWPLFILFFIVCEESQHSAQ